MFSIKKKWVRELGGEESGEIIKINKIGDEKKGEIVKINRVRKGGSREIVLGTVGVGSLLVLGLYLLGREVRKGLEEVAMEVRNGLEEIGIGNEVEYERGSKCSTNESMNKEKTLGKNQYFFNFLLFQLVFVNFYCVVINILATFKLNQLKLQTNFQIHQARLGHH